MDSAFAVPGLPWRFGLDAIIGLVPGIGDLLSGGISFAIIALAALRYRLPAITLARMGLNLAIDVLVGAIPLVGDAFDVYWKVNERNLDLIRRRAMGPDGQPRNGTAWDWTFVGLIAGALLLVMGGLGMLVWIAVAGVVGGLRG